MSDLRGPKDRPPEVAGFLASGVRCGVKRRGLDLALLVSDRPASAAGVFTRSTVVGAPVELSRRKLRSGRARGVVVNSGVSNVGMGTRGRRDAEAMCARAAAGVGCPASQMLVASTGVIGEPLPMGKLRPGIDRATRDLSARGLPRAARAIMTTDTVPKLAWRQLTLAGAPISIAGIAKGSGMIEPNMATMLSFLITDAAVASPFLARLLKEAADQSFNRVTIDGETSTSDSVLLFANGAAGGAALKGARSPGARDFAAALTEVCTDLARALARDGEGATKLVTVRVFGARTPAQAEAAARRIANSLLVKTAIFGADPNWGRILQTVGAGRIALDLAKVEVRLCGVPVFKRGASSGSAARRRAGARLAEDDVEIRLDLGLGRGEATMWTCDLTHDYIRINADYTT